MLMPGTRGGDRDLSFAPVRNDRPRRLTPEQIDQFNRDGFVRPCPVFGLEEARGNRAYMDFLLGEFRAAGRDSYAINGFHDRCRRLYDLATHPVILDYVEDLLGPNFVCWGTHFFIKLSGDPKVVPWHQDASFGPWTPARTVTAWLAIDDVDEQNAAVKFIPGTQRLGPLNWHIPEGSAVLDQELGDIEQLTDASGVVVNSLRAGEISLHADMIAHSSDANVSDRRRAGLTLRYCPVSVRSTGDEAWQKQSIVCRGTDPDGFWADLPRPAGEDLRLGTGQPIVIGDN
jgi:non-haem Fe2+, alpha-ketoglutarate-dependent halogenase